MAVTFFMAGEVLTKPRDSRAAHYPDLYSSTAAVIDAQKCMRAHVRAGVTKLTT